MALLKGTGPVRPFCYYVRGLDAVEIADGYSVVIIFREEWQKLRADINELFWESGN